MTHDGSGDAQIRIHPTPFYHQYDGYPAENGFHEEAEDGIPENRNGQDSSNFVVFSICMLYDIIVFLLLFMVCLVVMQIGSAFSSTGLEVYRNSLNYFKVIYMVIILKAGHTYFDKGYWTAHRNFAAQFYDQSFFKNFPNIASTCLLALSYIKIIEEFYEMKSKVFTNEPYFINGIKYVICVFYINYFNLCRSIRDAGRPTVIHKLVLRCAVFISSILVIGQFWKCQNNSEKAAHLRTSTSNIPFLEQFVFVAALTNLFSTPFVVAVNYFSATEYYQLRVGNKFQELIWSASVSQILIHCFLETETFLQTEPESQVDLKFWAGMFYSVLITQITVLG